VERVADDNFAALLALGFTKLELASFISLNEASRVSSLSEDTLEREHADKIVKLSPKRRAMRLGHALTLSAKK
jgi:hypothetical protein